MPLPVAFSKPRMTPCDAPVAACSLRSRSSPTHATPPLHTDRNTAPISASDCVRWEKSRGSITSCRRRSTRRCSSGERSSCCEHTCWRGYAEAHCGSFSTGGGSVVLGFCGYAVVCVVRRASCVVRRASCVVRRASRSPIITHHAPPTPHHAPRVASRSSPSTKNYSRLAARPWRPWYCRVARGLRRTCSTTTRSCCRRYAFRSWSKWAPLRPPCSGSSTASTLWLHTRSIDLRASRPGRWATHMHVTLSS
mmetsp:Transcript_67237/g.185277  ORF Transcript_67237/g.185277 Transcript_67237/m.185277 type:complete len:251 (+) Transcript_67237:530-1282(+)